MPEAQPASGQRTSRRDVWTAFGVVVSAIGIIVTIWLTSTGWRQTAQDQIELERTKANVQLINDQIRYLYGPIYGYMRASTESWREFRKQYRPGKPFWGSKPDPTPEEKEAWMRWMKTVFIPINDAMSKVILENEHLIDGKEIPKSFADFLTHVETWKPVVAAWEKK